MSLLNPSNLLVSTSDRYDLAWERASLAAVADLDVQLIAGTPRNEDELIELARDADGLLISSRDAMSERAMLALTRCKVISRYAVGLDNIDLAAATACGIVVTHFPDYCTNEVADHAMALLLALNRRVVQLDRDLRGGAWATHEHHMDRLLRGPIPALRDSTLGIVGFGRIGRSMASRAASFGLRVVVSDPYVDPTAITAAGATANALPDLLAASDIVSLHCPLSPETRHLIDRDALAGMKRGALLINTARGPIVDLDAAAEALTSGSLGGAALDVVDPEPLPMESPLFGFDNVILTPHAAYYSERSVRTVREQTLLAAVDVLRGKRPPVVANPEVLERVALSVA